jgi:Cu-Zn family superoxide dismutase
MKRAISAMPMALALCAPTPAAEGDQVAAQLSGDGIRGAVTMTETGSGTILVTVTADGVPEGAHGFHVHEFGECDPATGFESAGGHLAAGLEHGLAREGGPHPGDFPNVFAQSDGVVQAEFFTRGFTVGSEGQRRVLDADGSAVILHAGADDYASQPSGDAGARIACGVLRAVN